MIERSVSAMNRRYRRNTRPYGQVIDAMNRAGRILRENFVFNGEDPYAGQGMQMTPEEMAAMEGQAAQGSQISPDVQQYVDQIRQISLTGIQQFAQDVDSEEYDFFKKVWLMCDKLMSEKEKGDDA